MRILALVRIKYRLLLVRVLLLVRAMLIQSTCLRSPPGTRLCRNAMKSDLVGIKYRLILLQRVISAIGGIGFYRHSSPYLIHTRPLFPHLWPTLEPTRLVITSM